VIFYGCLLAGGGAGDISGVTEPFVLMQSDATQAYCQADLGGKATWIRLPPERWPEGWKGMKDPVCKLVKALYGHPNSGSYWEEKCDRKITMEGFEPVGDSGEWRSCYIHKGLGVMLVVYVDDFKMAGLKSNCEAAWDKLRTGEEAITMDDPSDIDAYLGCTHKVETVKASDGVEIKMVQYDMQSFLEQCVASYVSLVGTDENLVSATTPFIDEDDCENTIQAASRTGSRGHMPLGQRVLPKGCLRGYSWVSEKGEG